MENVKIVIVDDDPGIRDSVQTILESRQYTVITAANRMEGMDKIKAEKPDLLILDIMMSSWLDGLDMSKGALTCEVQPKRFVGDEPTGSTIM